MKATDKESEEFAYFKQKFPKISEAKLKEGIFFFFSKITQLLVDQVFSTKLNFAERRAWKEFENIYRNFTGNKKDENYKETVQQLISSYIAFGV